MVDDVMKLGELLKLPNLEQDTVALINAKMREGISIVRPKTAAEIEHEKDQIKNLLEEYMNGPKQGGGE